MSQTEAKRSARQAPSEVKRRPGGQPGSQASVAHQLIFQAGSLKSPAVNPDFQREVFLLLLLVYLFPRAESEARRCWVQRGVGWENGRRKSLEDGMQCCQISRFCKI